LLQKGKALYINCLCRPVNKMKMKKFCFAKRAIEIVEKRTKSAQKIIKNVIVTLTLAVPLMYCVSCNAAADEEEYTGTKIRIIYTDRTPIESEEAPQILNKDLMMRLHVDPARVEKVFIPASVLRIDNCSFMDWGNLQKVILGNGSQLESIEKYAFRNCKKLNSFLFEKAPNLQTIGESAFYDCKGLTSITIHTAVREIGEYAFFRCDHLANALFARDSAIKTLKNSIFSHCAALQEVVLPLQLKSIGESAFWSTGISSIALPPDLQEISACAFGNTALTAILIPASVRNLAHDAFWDSRQLKNIRFAFFQNLPKNFFFDAPDGCEITFADNNAMLRFTQNTGWEQVEPWFSLQNVCLVSAGAIFLGAAAFVFWKKVLAHRFAA
jgi:hypothetical protein